MEQTQRISQKVKRKKFLHTYMLTFLLNRKNLCYKKIVLYFRAQIRENNYFILPIKYGC